MNYNEKKEFLDTRTAKLGLWCPPGTLPLVDRWLSSRKFHLKISRDRLTKLGDFRPASGRQAARISINHNLHPVEFIITLAHEIAHYDVFRDYRKRKMPHGEEWKDRFRALLREIVESGALTTEVNDAIMRCYFLREGIASSSCMQLKKVLEMGEEKRVLRVADLSEGEQFMLRNGKAFIKGERIRVRYRCTEVESGRIFTVHPLAEVVKKEP